MPTVLLLDTPMVRSHVSHVLIVLNFVRTYLRLLLDSNQAIYPNRLLLQGMVLFKDCLGQWTSAKQVNVERGNRGSD